MGMVLYGKKNTLSVTKEMMIEHGKAVVENTKRSLVVVDLPMEPMKVQKKLSVWQQKFYLKQVQVL